MFDKAFTGQDMSLCFIDQYWKPFNTEIDERYFALAFISMPLSLRRAGDPKKAAGTGWFL